MVRLVLLLLVLVTTQPGCARRVEIALTFPTTAPLGVAVLVDVDRFVLAHTQIFVPNQGPQEPLSSPASRDGVRVVVFPLTVALLTGVGCDATCVVTTERNEGAFPVFPPGAVFVSPLIDPRNPGEPTLAPPASPDEEGLIDFVSVQLRLAAAGGLDALVTNTDATPGSDSAPGTDAVPGTDGGGGGTDSATPPTLCGTYPGELFCDGFESGAVSFPPWASENVQGAAAAWSVGATISPWRGAFALRMTAELAGDVVEIRAPIAGSPTTGTLAFRGFIYRPVGPQLDDSIWFLEYQPVGTNLLMFPSTGNDDLWIFNDPEGMFSATSGTLSRGAWQCLEFIIQLDTGSNGSVEVRLNGFQILMDTGLNTSGPGGVSELEFSIHATPAVNVHEIFWDEIVIANQPVGCN